MSLVDMFVATNDTDTHRVCGMCGQLKSVDNFYKDGIDKEGVQRYRRDCKDCYKAARMHEIEMKNRGDKSAQKAR